jgi:glycosyltransferase involved in cell wall biosynthesis
MPAYVIITPAHNEEAFIEQTIKSVIAQTVLPLRWVIVNDGSVDHTADIVRKYTAQHNFIKLVDFERKEGRDFGKKVAAFNRGLAEMHGLTYDYIGNLDADISFEPNYYESILREFKNDLQLGIAGGMIDSYIGDKFICQNVALDSVGGQVQLFRRECFEQIGGYIPLPHGGIDAAAEITARMRGWSVRTFPKYRVLEHRRTGWAAGRPFASKIEEGKRMYLLGYAFSFFILRCVYRVMERPRILGSIGALYGYMRLFIRHKPILLPAEVVEYLRTEQRGKLLDLLSISGKQGGKRRNGGR